MCRIELRKAVLKIDRCVETPFMRVGLDAQEQVIGACVCACVSVRECVSLCLCVCE